MSEPTYPEAIDPSRFLNVRWQASPNTLIGGWCIQPAGEKPLHEGGGELGDFMTRKLAEHVVELHNATLPNPWQSD